MPIVTSYHGTPESREALATAVDLARNTGSRVITILARRAYRGDERTATTAAQTLRELLDGEDIAFDVREADASEEISEAVLRTAREVDAEFIVIGLRRRSPNGALAMGRNAQRILLEAPCPVVTATAPAVTGLG